MSGNSTIDAKPGGWVAQAARAVAGQRGRDYMATGVLIAALGLTVLLSARIDYLQQRWQDRLDNEAGTIAALNDSGTGVVVFDDTGRVVATNNAARNLLGLDLGRQYTVHDFHGMAAVDAVVDELSKLRNTARVESQSYRTQKSCLMAVPVGASTGQTLKPLDVVVRVVPRAYGGSRIVAFVTQQDQTDVTSTQ